MKDQVIIEDITHFEKGRFEHHAIEHFFIERESLGNLYYFVREKFDFFFNDKKPCFQIILQIDNRDIIYGEFDSYKSYKNIINTLRTAEKDNLKIILPSKIPNIEAKQNVELSI